MRGDVTRWLQLATDHRQSPEMRRYFKQKADDELARRAKGPSFGEPGFAARLMRGETPDDWN